jgi:hypothetical protein
MEYHYEQRATLELMRQLRDRRPVGVDADRWEYASGWAITAYCNICFSPGYVPLDELKRFRTELEERLREPVDLTTIDWVWERLGKTGAHGQKYRERFEPEYREGLKNMTERRQ